MHYVDNTELSSHEETRSQFNGGTGAIKLGVDVHQDFYVVVEQVGGGNPKPPQRFRKEAFLHWATRLKQKSGAQVHAVYEACGFGFALQRKLSALGIHCYVVCPQKLDEQNRRVKTDGLDAKALCLKLDRFVQGNRDALAIVRVPTEEEEQARAIHRQREQLVKARKQLEAQGRSLMVNHGLEPVHNWWKPRTFPALPMPHTKIWTPAEVLAIAFAHPPNFPPGTAYEYNNTNYRCWVSSLKRSMASRSLRRCRTGYSVP